MPQQRSLLLPVVLLLVLPVGLGYLLFRPPPPYAPSFDGPDRLVTNARAHHAAADPRSRLSRDWRVTSGSLFARNGAGWTGKPDRVAPNAGSTDGTGSAVFRAVSQREDFRDVRVSLRLRIEALTKPANAHAYDGAHMFLRYQGPHELYGVTMFRRDGSVVVKRKSGGQYVTLGIAYRTQPRNRWVDVVVRVSTLESGAVRFTLRMDGDLVLVAYDRGRRGPAITDPGRVGLRGDNCQFSFTDFRAEEEPP